MWVMSIGTNEIRRSAIDQCGLGLPRSASVTTAASETRDWQCLGTTDDVFRNTARVAIRDTTATSTVRPEYFVAGIADAKRRTLNSLKRFGVQELSP